MTDDNGGTGASGRAAFKLKTAEFAVAAGLFALGAIVIGDSVRLGHRWGEDGPQAGYFPFYIGLLICIASVINGARAAMIPAAKDSGFVETGQLRLVLSVLLPSAVYAGLIGWLGIYVASIVFIAFFMRWLGKYRWLKIALVSVGNSVVFFLIFEVWFKLPLPKGPVEAVLGLN
jgi:hypothetical protein